MKIVVSNITEKELMQMYLDLAYQFKEVPAQMKNDIDFLGDNDFTNGIPDKITLNDFFEKLKNIEIQIE